MKFYNKRVEWPTNCSSVVLQINKRKESKTKKKLNKSFCCSVSVFRFLHSKQLRSLFSRKLKIKMALNNSVAFVK